jgi:2-hydroxychromene-2-carboxylate isomerase
MIDDFGIETSRLTILLDIRNPYSYLGIEPALALAEESGLEINWLPLKAQPLKAPSLPHADDDRGIRHRRNRAEAMANEIAIYAAAQGLEIRDYYREPDPDTFHQCWLWLHENDPALIAAFLREAFRAYWASQLDLSHVAAIEAPLTSAGASYAGLKDWLEEHGPTRAAALREFVGHHGRYGMPCYLIEDEIIYGRQHLPLIRWILNERKGQAPI